MVVVIGSRGNVVQSYVMMEGMATAVPSYMSGLDRAFKAHYIFNIAYSSGAEHLWQWLQKVVYKIHDGTNTFASVHELQSFFGSKRQ
jgi:hypothetical protein